MIRVKNFRRQISKRFAAIILTFTTGIAASFVVTLHFRIQDIQLQDNQPSDVFDIEIYQPPDYEEGTECARPGPLFLFLRMDENRQTRLNMDNFGTLSDDSELFPALESIFAKRTKHEAFRANSKEIEKTVLVRVDKSTSHDDLVTLIRGLKQVGANPIQLYLDDCLVTIGGKCD